MRKIVISLLLLALCLAPAAGMAEPLRVGALKGPTAMGLVKLMEDSEGGEDYLFTLAASPDTLIPGLLQGEIDLACIPANLAAILYANTDGAVRAVNINTLGVLYLLERGEGVRQLSDLKGRTIYASGKASTPEYVLSHLLALAGVTDVNVEWKSEHAEALVALMNDPAGVAMLPQPFATLALEKSPDIRVAADLNREWEAFSGGVLITGVTVARKELTEGNTVALDRFLSDHQDSVRFVSGNTSRAAALIGKYGILNAQTAEKALPYCAVAFVQGHEMKEMLDAFYQVLFRQNPASTGGRIPDDALYYVP